MLIGFGQTEPALPGQVTGGAVELLGSQQPADTKQVCEGDWCLSRTSHLKTETYKAFGYGVMLGVFAGMIGAIVLVK